MFKISEPLKQTYAEVNQVNPLRWVMLYRTGADTFERQTGEIKCKDFFNDTLAYFKEGKVFNMYGYVSEKKKNDEGVYFLLNNIGDMDSFMSNMEVLNDKMAKQLGTTVLVYQQDKTSAVILTPNEVWTSTWRLSLVTMLIRCCNYGVKYEKWEDFYRSDAPMNHQEQAFNERAKTNTKAWGFLVPEKYSKYWWYGGEDFNSVKKPGTTGGTIHNNGCVSWSTFMDKAVAA